MKKFENFKRSLHNLKDIYDYEEPYGNVELVGLVGLYEICFEQSWKAMKEVLLDNGYSESKTGSPKLILKTAFQADMIDDEKLWLDALVSRNNVAHAYNKDIAQDIINRTKNDYYNMFKKLEKEIEDNWIDGYDEDAGVTENDGEDVSVVKGVSVKAYVDGSYEHSIGRYAYGCVILLQDEVIELNGSDNDEDYVTMRNVAGEILGSETAIKWAVEHGYKEIEIYYDYEGIEKWADDIWKANKPGTIRYKQFVKEQREKIKITFKKVAAHTGDKYNEMADELAKKALGLI